MAGLFNYETTEPSTANAIAGYRECSSIFVGLLFVICTMLLVIYKLNKKVTLDLAAELEARRQKSAAVATHPYESTRRCRS